MTTIEATGAPYVVDVEFHGEKQVAVTPGGGTDPILLTARQAMLMATELILAATDEPSDYAVTIDTGTVEYRLTGRIDVPGVAAGDGTTVVVTPL